MAKNNFISQELVDIYVPIDVADALAMGIHRSDIYHGTFGVRRLSCIRIKGTVQQARDYRHLLTNEMKAEDRDQRCLNPDGRGGFIRCPECNRCSECNRHVSLDDDSNLPLSLDKLMDGDDEEDATFDIAGQGDIADDAITLTVLADLLAYLASLDPRYANVFQALFEQQSVSEIAEDQGLAWSTAKDLINKVRRLAQERVGDAMRSTK